MITLSSNMDMEVSTMNPALDEPADDLLDALIDLIEARADESPDLGAWAIEALADGLGCGVVVTHPDHPEDRVKRLTDALLDAFAEGSRK